MCVCVCVKDYRERFSIIIIEGWFGEWRKVSARGLHGVAWAWWFFPLSLSLSRHQKVGVNKSYKVLASSLV